MTAVKLSRGEHELLMLHALSDSNRADFAAHYPAKRASVDSLVQFYWEFNGGEELFGEE